MIVINWRDTTHSEDDYRTDHRNVSHCQQQQSYSGLRSTGRSNSTYFWNDPWVQTFHKKGTGDEMCLAVVSVIVTRDAPVIYWPIFFLVLYIATVPEVFAKVNSFQFPSCCRIRGFRFKTANFSRLHCLAIPKRDLSTKKTKPNKEKWSESLGVMLQFWYIVGYWVITIIIYTHSLPWVLCVKSHLLNSFAFKNY